MYYHLNDIFVCYYNHYKRSSRVTCACNFIIYVQGLCVAFLFCFTNHDVMVAMRTHMTRVLRANDAIALTGDNYPLPPEPTQIASLILINLTLAEKNCICM